MLRTYVRTYVTYVSLNLRKFTYVSFLKAYISQHELGFIIFDSVKCKGFKYDENIFYMFVAQSSSIQSVCDNLQRNINAWCLIALCAMSIGIRTMKLTS